MSTFTHESMTNHHGSGLLAQLSETFHVWRKRQRRRGANWPNGPTATCMMSAFPGATSFTRPKSRFGGHNRRTRPATVDPVLRPVTLESKRRRTIANGSHFGGSCALASPRWGTPATVFSEPAGACHDRASSRRSPATFRYSAAAQRQVADGALRRAARCGGVAGLLPVALGRLSLQSLPRRHERVAANRARSLHPCRRGRPLQRDRDHDDRRF